MTPPVVPQNPPRAPPVVLPGSGNSIIINSCQRPNPVLEHIKNVPKEFGDIKPDFQVGRTTCILYLSLKYHRLHPEYIGGRIEKLGNAYNLRVVLVLCDVTEHQQPLRELTKMCLINNITIIVAFSPEDAGQYIATFKQYEHKPPDLIKERVDKDYNSVLRAALTSISKVNKTDVETLRTQRGSFADIARATPAQLSMLPGFGQIKVRRIKDAFEKPFRNNATNSTGPRQIVDVAQEETYEESAVEDTDPPQAGPSHPAVFTWETEPTEGRLSNQPEVSDGSTSRFFGKATANSERHSDDDNEDVPRIPASAKGKGRAREPPTMKALPAARTPMPREPSPAWDIEFEDLPAPISRSMGPPATVLTRTSSSTTTSVTTVAPTTKRRSIYDVDAPVRVVSTTTVSTRAPTKKPPPRPRPVRKQLTQEAELGPPPETALEVGDKRPSPPDFDLDLNPSDEEDGGPVQKRTKV